MFEEYLPQKKALLCKWGVDEATQNRDLIINWLVEEQQRSGVLPVSNGSLRHRATTLVCSVLDCEKPVEVVTRGSNGARCTGCKYRVRKGCALLVRPCNVRLVWSGELDPPENCPKYEEFLA